MTLGTLASDIAETAVSVTGRVLVVDAHRSREAMASILCRAGHHVQCVTSAIEALQLLENQSFDVLITVLEMPGMTGLDFIRQLECRRHGAQILMVTAYATISSAVEAMRHGAFDYIEKPFDSDQLTSLVGRAIQHGRLLEGKENLPCPSGGSESLAMVGSSQAMQTLRAKIAQIAPTPETVLITGESGTGKELVARAIHLASGRCQKPLVSLNCPALSFHLMESELFGHERGAFTGADAPRIGRFKLADGGTILLDEVTEIDLALQSKLLRVLQERSFEPVGSSETIKVDVRVLASTNRDLTRAVANGKFREDLYYRLAVVPIHVPPLRERLEDVAPLVEHFLLQVAVRLGKDPFTLDRSASELLSNYHWPGNVRELQNIITRACVLHVENHSPISAESIHPWLIEPHASDPGTSAEIPVGLSLHEMEQQLIEATLEKFDGHRNKTASALGIGVRTLAGKLKSYGYAPRQKTPDKAA